MGQKGEPRARVLMLPALDRPPSRQADFLPPVTLPALPCSTHINIETGNKPMLPPPPQTLVSPFQKVTRRPKLHPPCPMQRLGHGYIYTFFFNPLFYLKFKFNQASFIDFMGNPNKFFN